MAKTKRESSDGWGGYESPAQESLRKAQERAAQVGGGGDKRPYVDPAITMYRTKDDNHIRIVPPIEVKELQMFGADIFLHRGVGPNREIFPCLARMWNEVCPVCSLQTAELWETNRDIAKKYYPEYKILCWIIDRLNPTKDQLLLWAMPKSIMEQILNQSNRKEAQVMIDVAHPLQGRDIYFSRFKEGDFTKYKDVQIGDTPNALPGWVASARKLFSDVIIKPDPAEFARCVNISAYAPDIEETTAGAPGEVGGDVTVDPIVAMVASLDIPALRDIIAKSGLDVKPGKSWTVDDYRTAVCSALTRAMGGEAVQEPAAPTIPEPAPIPDEIADCFGKNADEYEECDNLCATNYPTFRARCFGICGKPLTTPKAAEAPPPFEPDPTPAQAPVADSALMDRIKAAVAQRKGA